MASEPDPALPCRDSPNCVSTLADPADAEHHIAPFAYEGEPKAALDRLVQVVATVERSTLVARGDDWAHFSFKSKVVGFVDDVHVRLEDGAVQFRSQSRVGHSDLGVNRTRMEDLRTRWQAP